MPFDEVLLSVKKLIAAVLHRFGYVLRKDILASVKVGNGAGYAEYAVIASGGEAESFESAAHQFLAFAAEGAVMAHLTGLHIGIAGSALIAEAAALDGSCGVDSCFYLCACLTLGTGAERIEIQSGNFDNYVYAVHKRTGNAALILAQRGLCAAAASAAMAIPSAFAGIHCAYQHKAAGEGAASCGAGDGYLSVLKRLAQNFKSIAGKFGKLVQK